MKTFCELYFYASPSRLKEFTGEILAYAKGCWSAGINDKYGTKWIYFNYTGTDVDKASVCISVINSSLSDGRLCVNNIVPLDKNELSIDEYNRVLKKFYSDIVKPYEMDHPDITIPEITTDQFDPTMVISEEALKKLKAFCNLANKTTGSSHPCDQERWFDFICQTVDDEKMIDYTTLAKFLQDEDYWGKNDGVSPGSISSTTWDDESAYELAEEYERACSILQYYKRSRGL